MSDIPVIIYKSTTEVGINVRYNGSFMYIQINYRGRNCQIYVYVVTDKLATEVI